MLHLVRTTLARISDRGALPANFSFFSFFGCEDAFCSSFCWQGRDSFAEIDSEFAVAEKSNKPCACRLRPLPRSEQTPALSQTGARKNLPKPANNAKNSERASGTLLSRQNGSRNCICGGKDVENALPKQIPRR